MSADRLTDAVDHEPGEPADERAVDADELQVATDGQLDAAARFVGVPLLDRGGDEVGDLVPAGVDDVARRGFDPRVDLVGERGVGRDAGSERRGRPSDACP
jgi:hypothetical protein